MSYRLPTGLVVYERRDWGARYGDGYDDAPTPATDVWLHHSATIAPDLIPPFGDDDAAVRTLERIGQERFQAGISYTFPVTPVGRAYVGHSIHRAGAHTLGHNFSGRAICLIGNYSERPPTAAQIDAAAQLLAAGKVRGWWTRAALSGGHRDAPPRHTDCPGDAAEHAIPEINARAAWHLARQRPQPPSEGEPRDRAPTKPQEEHMILVGAPGRPLLGYDPATGIGVTMQADERDAMIRVHHAAAVPLPSVTITAADYDALRGFAARERAARTDDQTP